MAKGSDPFEEQIRFQREERALLEAEQRQAEQECSRWPDLRTSANERALPALKSWHASLRPYTSPQRRRGYVRRLRWRRWEAGRIPWLHPGAIRRRFQLALLWVIVWRTTIAQALLLLLLAILAIYAFINRDQISAFVQGLLDSLR